MSKSQYGVQVRPGWITACINSHESWVWARLSQALAAATKLPTLGAGPLRLDYSNYWYLQDLWLGVGLVEELWDSLVGLLGLPC